MVQVVGIDTNIFIYYYEQHPQFGFSAKSIFALLVQNKTKAVTSVITLIELFSLQAPLTNIDRLESFYLATPNLTTCEVSRTIAKKAAEIRRNYRFRLPDAIQLATAVLAKADIFITNDQKLQAFQEIKVVLLTERA